MGFGNDMGADRIQMNVPQNGQEVRVAMNELCLVPPLETVACGFERLVSISRVAHRDTLHEFAQRVAGDLQ
jgi:hypothetical protein